MKRRDIIILIESLIRNNHKKIHIVLNNRRFYNGSIISYSDEDTISFLDNKLGYINILYSQIINVEPFVEKCEKEIK